MLFMIIWQLCDNCNGANAIHLEQMVDIQNHKQFNY